jgi:FKBP-type peptidyl-prolyl cis-trans isomerase
MTKQIIFSIVAIGAIGGVVWWLGATPPMETAPGMQQQGMQTVEPTAAPAGADGPTSAPTAAMKTTTTSNKRVQNGMTIETTIQGTGPEIKSGQTAVVDYVGKLPDGTVFDASARHGQDFEFSLGAGQVIKGWDQGVLGMKVGEKRTLTIPPELAYGERGIPGAIPANATLIFDVTLKGIK